MSTYSVTMNSPIGVLKLGSDERNLKMITFDAEHADSEDFIPDILLMAKSQLEEYFAGKRVRFDLPIDPDGTEFQQRVWNEITSVGFGLTKSYCKIAQSLGNDNSSRAVGMANGKNPLPIVIPCHRIIGNNGKLTGYSGGINRKIWLLLHERTISGTNGLFSANPQPL